jgi:hypothetical protein
MTAMKLTSVLVTLAACDAILPEVHWDQSPAVRITKRVRHPLKPGTDALADCVVSHLETGANGGLALTAGAAEA